MFLDIDAAKTLGMGEDAIAQNMVNRGQRRAFGFLNEGLFRPYFPSRDVAALFENTHILKVTSDNLIYIAPPKPFTPPAVLESKIQVVKCILPGFDSKKIAAPASLYPL